MRIRAGIRGFSLVELLLVLAIIGIISAIAIPAFLGQRRRARIIGDAQTNARVMASLLETRKAENGIYGPGGGAYTWNVGVPPSDPTFLPSFTPQGNSRMNFTVSINNHTAPTYIPPAQGAPVAATAANPLAYLITVSDPNLGGGTTVYQTNQTGAEVYKLLN